MVYFLWVLMGKIRCCAATLLSFALLTCNSRRILGFTDSNYYKGRTLCVCAKSPHKHAEFHAQDIKLNVWWWVLLPLLYFCVQASEWHSKVQSWRSPGWDEKTWTQTQEGDAPETLCLCSVSAASPPLWTAGGSLCKHSTMCRWTRRFWCIEVCLSMQAGMQLSIGFPLGWKIYMNIGSYWILCL